MIWVILSMVKFQFCLISSIAISSLYFLFLTFIGGIIGVFFFTYLGHDIEQFLIKKFPRYFKKFSKKNRRLVNLRRRVGINGISLLTPILFGIPIGISICLSLTDSRRRIIIPMLISVTFWTIISLILILI
jgi:hypothetical protein